MVETTLLQHGPIEALDYRCDASPGDEPFVEQHGGYSVAYVRRGSFRYTLRGASHEMVAGSVLVGSLGDEYVCAHDHVVGDECLSFFLAPSVVEALGSSDAIWRIGAVPPLPDLMVLGELAQAAADGRS